VPSRFVSVQVSPAAVDGLRYTVVDDAMSHDYDVSAATPGIEKCSALLTRPPRSLSIKEPVQPRSEGSGEDSLNSGAAG